MFIKSPESGDKISEHLILMLLMLYLGALHLQKPITLKMLSSTNNLVNIFFCKRQLYIYSVTWI